MEVRTAAGHRGAGGLWTGTAWSLETALLVAGW